MTRTALYRHFDAAGQLLYVGISLSAVQRLGQHRDTAGWYGLIKRVEIEWLPGRLEALHAEAVAIARESPVHNIQRPGKVPPLFTRDSGERRAMGVRHRRTGKIDGWYFKPVDATHMLGWFRAVFPAETFDLVEPDKEGNTGLNDAVVLRWLRWKEWASAAPNLAAGDAFDWGLSA